MTKRTAIPVDSRIRVLTESGYRCAVPTCRTILLIDLHHMVEVSEGGGNAPSNLLPLCPNCHALYHREKIDQRSIAAWKSLIVSLNAALSINALDDLLFLANQPTKLELSADGIARFSQLIGSGYVTWSGTSSTVQKFAPKMSKGRGVLDQMAKMAEQPNGAVFVPARYTARLTEKGKALVDALTNGDLDKLGDSTSTQTPDNKCVNGSGEFGPN